MELENLKSTEPLVVVEIEERFLHCTSRRVRRSEREEKASARFGRNDSYQNWDKRKGQS